MPRSLCLFCSSSLSALLWVAMPLKAQETDCSSIDEKVERIRCIMAAEERNVATSYSPPEKDWSLVRSKSEMTDEMGVYGGLKAEATVSCGLPGATRTPYLRIQCHENETALVLSVGCFMSDAGDFGEVRLRVDGREAIAMNFVESSDNSALGLWGAKAARPVLDYVSGSKSLLIEFAPYREATQTARFKTDGVDTVIGAVRDQCGW
jgi:hypothetical protein